MITLKQSGMTVSDSNRPAAVNTAAIAAAVSNAQLQNNTGVYDISGGRVIDMLMVPPTIDFTATSGTATGAVTTTVYALNTNTFNALVTTNGSVASSITNTYGDGFTGKYYEQLMRSANGGKGVRVYGYSLQYTIAASGNSDPVGLANAALTMLSFTGNAGESVPVFLNNSIAKRNTQYISGLLTFKWDAYLNASTQFSLSLPAGDSVQISWFTTPNF